jgi:hypothetical protein
MEEEMFTHPSIHTEIARQRQQALLGEREGDRIAKILLADSRPPKEAKPRHRPFSTLTVRRPQRAGA